MKIFLNKNPYALFEHKGFGLNLYFISIYKIL